ncbi:MAG: UvrD-helicase domain-containing protein [Bacteroidia bacterium]|nr:UvrD-helicase domain-containing protein [Bacteroidia bacterium]
MIRSFTRESGIIGDYRLEVEHENVMEEVIDNLIDELGANNEITDWVVEFARENLENERAWDVRDALLNFSKEIFREEFKAIEELVLRTTSDREFFRNFRKQLWQQRNDFFTQINGPAESALHILSKVSWDANDIYYGRNSGLFSFFEAFAGERDLTKLKVSDRVRNDFVIPEKWPGKKTIHARDIVAVAREQLVPIVEELIQVFDTQYEAAVSADAVLKNMYVFGLITDISRKLKEYKDDNNLMLLADAPKFLNGVIQDSDTPFIYEKVGSFYRNFLIDEFQDTSGLQWKIFYPCSPTVSIRATRAW